MTARDCNSAVRSWQEIAAELAKETEAEKFERLAEQLLAALERDNVGLPHPSKKAN